jgi:NAD-dependent DNA ligase
LLNDELNIKISGGEKKGKICFTNVRDKEVEEKLELAGYEIVNSVTKDTTILVIPNGFTGSSSKIDKAKKYGIKILQIGDYELFKLYGGK